MKNMAGVEENQEVDLQAQKESDKTWYVRSRSKWRTWKVIINLIL